jgi:hypothetical protein
MKRRTQQTKAIQPHEQSSLTTGPFQLAINVFEAWSAIRVVRKLHAALES